MEYFKKIFGVEPKAPGNGQHDMFDLPGNGKYGLEVANDPYDQHNLEQIWGPRKEEGERLDVAARLVLDDKNFYDTSAVRVEVNGLRVGHLSRPFAIMYRDLLKRSGHRPDAIGECKARIRGGWLLGSRDRGHYVVWLDILIKG